MEVGKQIASNAKQPAGRKLMIWAQKAGEGGTVNAVRSFVSRPALTSIRITRGTRS